MRHTTPDPGGRLRRSVLLWLGVLALGLAASTAPAADARDVEVRHAGAGSPYVRLLEQGPAGVRVSVRIPTDAYRVSTADDDTQVELAGVRSSGSPGRYRLPALVVTLAVPEHGEIVPQVSPGTETRLPAKPPTRVALPRADDDPSIFDGGVTDTADGLEDVVEVDVVRYRGLRLARLRILPARYDALAGELHLAHELEIGIAFSGDAPIVAPADTGWEPIARSVLNRESITMVERKREHDSAKTRQPADKSLTVGGGPAVKVRVGESGVVRVTGAQLATAGLDLASLDVSRLGVSFRGIPVPARLVGDEDLRLDPEDSLEFYADVRPTRFSTESIYRIEVIDSPAPRFPSRSAEPRGAPAVATFPGTLRFEGGNEIYSLGKPAAEGDPHFFWAWFEDNPNPPRVTELSQGTTLPGVATAGEASLRAAFSGRTDTVADPDHRMSFRVNGSSVGTTTWSGLGLYTAEVTFDAGNLRTGWNSFVLRTDPVAVPDIVYLDWFEVTYPRRTEAVSDRLELTTPGTGDAVGYAVTGFAGLDDPLVLDVSDPLAPVRLTDVVVEPAAPGTLSFEDTRSEPGRYVVVGDGGRIAPLGLTLDTPSDLRSAENGADLIVVVPEGWESALTALVEHRRAQGLRVVLANLTDVADEFAGGNVDDVAIRDFVTWAYRHWQPPAPAYLLLVGEPNMDPLNHLGRDPFHHVMPTHFGVTTINGETMSDTWFGAVDGDDLLPDVAVGRFSARTAAEAEAFAAKIIDYEIDPPLGKSWTRRILQIASNDRDFELALDDVLPLVPEHMSVRREFRRLGATTSSIQTSIGAGAVLATFVGHGNVTVWADVPGGTFFRNSDAASLGNADRLPFLIALNCMNGWVGHPVTISAMAESFQNADWGGALAVWSPSGLGYLEHHRDLQASVYRILLQDQVPWIGAATNRALVETWLTRDVSLDVVKELILIGDPAGFVALDGDDDGIHDHDEIRQGSDPGDRDSDDDGVLDAAEGPAGADADGDGLANAIDADADGDGLPDGLEAGIVSPGPDTDPGRGNFRADFDPSTTTDPLMFDTDGGGAADGVEDRNANGRVDAPDETDPRNPGDDPVCLAGAPPEAAAYPGEYLSLDAAGDDLILRWGSSVDPCTLYRVYVADGLDPADGRLAYRRIGVTAHTTFTHVGARSVEGRLRYLVTAVTAEGEGPWGHHE